MAGAECSKVFFRYGSNLNEPKHRKIQLWINHYDHVTRYSERIFYSEQDARADALKDMDYVFTSYVFHEKTFTY